MKEGRGMGQEWCGLVKGERGGMWEVWSGEGRRNDG